MCFSISTTEERTLGRLGVLSEWQMRSCNIIKARFFNHAVSARCYDVQGSAERQGPSPPHAASPGVSSSPGPRGAGPTATVQPCPGAGPQRDFVHHANQGVPSDRTDVAMEARVEVQSARTCLSHQVTKKRTLELSWSFVSMRR